MFVVGDARDRSLAVVDVKLFVFYSIFSVNNLLLWKMLRGRKVVARMKGNTKKESHILNDSEDREEICLSVIW